MSKPVFDHTVDSGWEACGLCSDQKKREEGVMECMQELAEYDRFSQVVQHLIENTDDEFTFATLCYIIKAGADSICSNTK